MLKTYAPLALLTLSAPCFAQDVIVVDDTAGSGADHSTIQDALDAAGDDDVILVREGTYASFTIDSKSAMVVADVRGTEVAGTISIRYVDSNSRVVVSGFDVQSTAGTALDLFSCDGTVLLEDLNLTTSGTAFSTNYGASVLWCEAVVLSSCTIDSAGGGLGGDSGLYASTSNLHAYDTTTLGGRTSDSTPAKPGLELENCDVFASNCTFTGGDGAAGESTIFQPCENGLEGGIGILAGPDGLFGLEGSLVRLFDSAGVGGQGGKPSLPPCTKGAAGLDVFEDSASEVIDLAPTLDARRYEAPTPMRSGEAQVLSWFGSPGELAWGAYSATAAPFYLELFSGIYVPGTPNTLLFVGTIPASGQLDVPVTVDLPTGQSHVALWQQGLFFSFEDGFVLGSPRSGLILAASY